MMEERADFKAELTKILGRERITMSGDIAILPPDFYTSLHTFLQAQDKYQMEAWTVSVNSFIDSRLYKIMRFATLATPQKDVFEKLTSEEKQLYKMVKESIDQIKAGVFK